MDTNYLDIEEYLLDPIEQEVEKALRILRMGDEMEEYDIIESISNHSGWDHHYGKAGKPRRLGNF